MMLQRRRLLYGATLAPLAILGALPVRAQTPPDAPPAAPGRPGMAPVRLEVGDRNVKALLIEDVYAWIGTSGGVIRLDRRDQTHIVYSNRNGLLSNGVFHLSRHGDEVWIGTYGGGLSVLHTGTWTFRNYNVPQGLADAFVYDVTRPPDGDVWIATWSGANRVRGGELDRVEAWDTFTVENTAGGLPNDWVYGLAPSPSGHLWLATEGGLAHFADGRWRNWNHEDGLGAPYELVRDTITFANDPARRSGHHALQKQEQGLQDVDVAYNPNYVVALTVAGDGTVWAGTWGGGLSSFDGARFRTFTVLDGLPANHVFALASGPDGRLWIGTSNGLARYDGRKFVRYGVEHGLISNVVFAIAFGSDGSAWIGSYGGVAWYPHGL